MTPNSFSDPKKFLDSSLLKTHLERYKGRTDLILDFGFESTAPMNQAISAYEERARFDQFFDAIKEIDLSGCWISFDTYRPSQYIYFEKQFKGRYKDLGFIFNDVSGVIDQELIELLIGKKNQENFYYVYSCTHIPSRDFVLNHMDFVKEGSSLRGCLKNLKVARGIFQEMGLEKKIIFDPCFGFSKSYEQNWELLDNLEELIRDFGVKEKWLVGISKKSFLRKRCGDGPQSFIQSEELHEKIIHQLLCKDITHILFRVHDFDIVQRALCS